MLRFSLGLGGVAVRDLDVLGFSGRLGLMGFNWFVGVFGVMRDNWAERGYWVRVWF